MDDNLEHIINEVGPVLSQLEDLAERISDFSNYEAIPTENNKIDSLEKTNNELMLELEKIAGSIDFIFDKINNIYPKKKITRPIKCLRSRLERNKSFFKSIREREQQRREMEQWIEERRKNRLAYDLQRKEVEQREKEEEEEYLRRKNRSWMKYLFGVEI